GCLRGLEARRVRRRHGRRAVMGWGDAGDGQGRRVPGEASIAADLSCLGYSVVLSEAKDLCAQPACELVGCTREVLRRCAPQDDGKKGSTLSSSLPRCWH